MRALLLLTALLLPGLLLPGQAQAQVLRARDTAEVRQAGSWSVGVFNPLTIALKDRLEIELHPLVAIASPHALVRVGHLQDGDWKLAGEYGLAFPLTALRLGPPLGLEGYLTPSCLVAGDDPSKAQWCQAPGWFLIPRAGVVLSNFATGVFTARADLSVGLLLAGPRGRPLDAPPVLDLLYAPMLNKFRARAGVAYDYPVLDFLRVRGEANLYLLGNTPEEPEASRSPLIGTAHLGVDLAVGKASRVTAGVMYFNSDQHATKVEKDERGRNQRVRVRSNDFLPTIDFIWSN